MLKTIPRSSFPRGYPTDAAAAALYDELDYQRAVQAFIWAVPLVNSVALAKGLVGAGVSPTEPSLLVFDRQLTPKQVIMTANSEVIYAFSLLDLAALGPVVAEVPDGVLGGVWDFWERGLCDYGVGETRHGGKLLLLPPGYAGEAPAGYVVVRSRTPKVFFAGRGILGPGDGTGAFVERVSTIRVYPLDQAGAPASTRVKLNGARPFDSDWPKDEGYFAYMAEGLRDAVIEPEDKLMMAMLEPLGIGPGKPFAPDARVRRLLAAAAETGQAMVKTLAFDNRFADRHYWPDRQWEKITFATTPTFETERAVELDQRAQGWYQLVGNGVYLYSAKPTPGEGSWYVSTYRDAEGRYLDGSRHYTLALPTDPPARAFWSATVYDVRTRSQIDAPQQRASLSSYSSLERGADGAIVLHFGPEPPPGGERNWIQTIPGQGFFVMFRLYGPLQPVFDRTWRLADVVKAP